MKKPVALFLTIACLGLLALPFHADARAGGGGSFGSRGGRTYASPSYTPSYNASPIQRSVTPQPGYNPQPAYTPGYTPGFAPSYGGGYGGHPFLSSLAGGFLGAGLFGALFGHGGGYGGSMGYGGESPAGSAFGGILQFLIIAGIGLMLFRWWRNRSGGGMSGFGPGGLTGGSDAPFNAAPSIGFPGANVPPTGLPLALTSGDQSDFRALLEKIQLAWGQGDLSHLRQYVTPEMLQYFSEELSANASRGQINRISDVAVTAVTPLESWSEYELDYATARMQWRAIDFMARNDKQPSDADYVADGNASQPTSAEEIWTFARAHGGGNWLLSAIQQVA